MKTSLLDLLSSKSFSLGRRTNGHKPIDMVALTRQGGSCHHVYLNSGTPAQPRAEPWRVRPPYPCITSTNMAGASECTHPLSRRLPSLSCCIAHQAGVGTRHIAPDEQQHQVLSGYWMALRAQHCRTSLMLGTPNMVLCIKQSIDDGWRPKLTRYSARQIRKILVAYRTPVPS